MQKEVKFQTEEFVEFVPEWASNYSEKKFTVFSTCFLSTKENSHKLDISEEILRRDAKSILGNFLVAKIKYGDAKSHEMDEIIYGYFPTEQEIEFEEVEEKGEKIVKAHAYCVISKMYGHDFNDIFSYNNLRNTSVEMTVETSEDDDFKVLGFDIYGLTCLGTTIKGSCPDANMKMVRFNKEEAETFFKENDESHLTKLQRFTESRKKLMEEQKTYKIDKSKEALSDKAWGDVDKTELRDKIMSAKNRDELVKAVYMLVEDGWQEAPSEHLKYPVMEIKGDALVYNKGGLASALGYAKAEDETAVVNKIEKIYKKLDLENGKEDDAKMAEEIKDEKFEIEGRKAWGIVIQKVKDHEGEGIYVDSIEKDHIIYTKGDVRYRVEADVKVSPDDKTVDAKIDWNTVKKDADQKMAEDCDDHHDDDDDEHDDHEEHEEDFAEMKAKCAKLESDIQDRDNIIMDKDKKMGEMETELEELRRFKEAIESEKLATSVEAVMSDVKDCMSEEKFNELRDEGLKCKLAEFESWKNKTQAVAFENSKGKDKKSVVNDIWSFSIPQTNVVNTQHSIWD